MLAAKGFFMMVRELRDTTPAERTKMVWPLTVAACALQGIDPSESGFRRL